MRVDNPDCKIKRDSQDDFDSCRVTVNLSSLGPTTVTPKPAPEGTATLPSTNLKGCSRMSSRRGLGLLLFSTILNSLVPPSDLYAPGKLRRISILHAKVGGGGDHTLRFLFKFSSLAVDELKTKFQMGFADRHTLN